MPIQTPTNFSDDALTNGSYVCAVLAGWLSFDNGESILEIFIAACNGLIVSAALLFVGLMLVGKPPGIYFRIKNGEPIDDIAPADTHDSNESK